MKHTSLLTACGLSLALFAGTGITAQPSIADSSKTCSSISMQAKVGKNTPVILVHGLGSSGSAWGEQDDKASMASIVKRVKGVYLDEPFDYKSTSSAWVANDNIGPRLARRIDCLATASKQAGGPGKVVIVGHSMGGLAARLAASKTVNNHAVGQEIGLLITLGTPNLGSGWANIGTNALRAACKFHIPTDDTPNDCDVDALVGLRTNSKEITSLPWMPKNVPVLAIAGDATVRSKIFTLGLRAATNDTDSDLVVSTKSALQDVRETAAGGGSSTVECYRDITTGLGLPDCWHSALTHNKKAEDLVTDALTKYVDSTKPETLSFDGLTIQVPKSWKRGNLFSSYVHDGTLGIRTGATCLSGTIAGNSCPGFELHGPDGLVTDYYNGTDYEDKWAFSRSDDPFVCAADPSMIMIKVNGYRSRSTALVGGKKSIYTEWNMSCVAQDDSGKTKSFIERTWWLPNEHYLIVDDWQTEGLYDILKNATWSAVSPFKNYTGQWHAAQIGMDISSSGEGTLDWKSAGGPSHQATFRLHRTSRGMSATITKGDSGDSEAYGPLSYTAGQEVPISVRLSPNSVEMGAISFGEASDQPIVLCGTRDNLGCGGM